MKVTILCPRINTNQTTLYQFTLYYFWWGGGGGEEQIWNLISFIVLILIYAWVTMVSVKIASISVREFEFAILQLVYKPKFQKKS